MGAYEDIYLPLLHPFLYILYLLVRAETADIVHRTRKVLESGSEGSVML